MPPALSGMKHLDAIAAIGGIEVVSVVGRDAGEIEGFANSRGIPHWATDWAMPSRAPMSRPSSCRRRRKLCAYPGGCVWVACFLAIGYYLGEQWQHMAHRVDTAVIVAAALIAVGSVVWWRLKLRKQK